MSWWNEDETKKEFEPIAEGNYLADLTNAKLDETKGTPKFVLEFTIADKIYKNRKIWINCPMGEKIGFARWQLSKLGSWDSISDMPDDADPNKVMTTLAKSTFELVNKIHCDLKVTHRDWQGKQMVNAIIEETYDGKAPETIGRLNVEPTTTKVPKFDSSEDLPF